MIGRPTWFILWQLANDGDRSAILATSINTPGIARNMAVAQAAGGGDLNGSSNTAHLLGQAGTAGQRINVPRASAGNYTGVV
jgi:hypothetical protein